MGLFFYRLMGAAMLDGAMYEGIEADRSVTWQAAAAVLLTSVAAGVGAGGWYGDELSVFVTGSLLALLLWLAWAVLMFHIGTRMLPEAQTRSTVGELLRTIGFASSPGLFLVFAIFPAMTLLVFSVTLAWMFAAMVFGVRHALDYQSNLRALAVCALAAGLALLLALVAGLVFAPAVS